METPSFPLPRDARERVVMDELVLIRDQLLLLKQDRSTYIRSQDVIPLYDKTIEQVGILHEIRTAAGHKEESRVDKIMEDCFQLLSLFYFTIGRNHEAPAAYALTSTIKRILEHLSEVDLYSGKDLESIYSTLAKLRVTLDQAEAAGSSDPHFSPILNLLVRHRLGLCQEMTDKLQKRLDRFSPCLLDKHEKLISLIRSMAHANTKSKFSSSEMKSLQQELFDLGDLRVNGNFCAQDGSIPPGSKEVSDVYELCLKWSEMVLERKGHVEDVWRPTYDALVSIRNDLEKLSLTQAWSLRETDLYDYQRQLDRYDESRINGNFYDENGNPADLWTQRTFLYLIRRSHAYIYSLMITSEPVSEALLPVYNQLRTLKRCLLEVKDNGGVSSVRELYPYSMKLTSLDNMRVDGKFVVNGDIPEGQGSVTQLLAECFDITYELRVAAAEGTEVK